MSAVDTKEVIMKVARSMVQNRGYNALSFREIAKEVGVKSASIHYHFPTKGDLGAALARRYSQDATLFLEQIEAQGGDLLHLFDQYTRIFRAALTNDNRMCLCGIMAAEYGDLPAEVRTEVDHFTEINVAWLSRILTRDNPSATVDQVRERAMAVFAAIEGAQLVARGRDDVGVFDKSVVAYGNGLLKSGF